LGRDLLNSKNANHYAFIIYHDEGQIGLVTGDCYFTKNINFLKEELHPLQGDNYSKKEQDSIKLKMSEVTTAFYETAKWMLMNNKKSSVFQP